MAKKVSTKKAEAQVEPTVIQRPDVDLAIEKRLVALYTLQSVDSEIDKHRTGCRDTRPTEGTVAKAGRRT